MLGSAKTLGLRESRSGVVDFVEEPLQERRAGIRGEFT
jgi:hypothetical protein